MRSECGGHFCDGAAFHRSYIGSDSEEVCWGRELDRGGDSSAGRLGALLLGLAGNASEGQLSYIRLRKLTVRFPSPTRHADPDLGAGLKAKRVANGLVEPLDVLLCGQR
jgi:hypothetical protein